MVDQPSNTPAGTGAGASSTGEAVATGIEGLASISKGILGVAEAMFNVVGKMANAVIDAAPLLQGVLKIVDKMFKIILLPIGQLLGKILLPYVIKMAKESVKLFQKYSNAGPDKMADMVGESVNLALSSLAELMGVVFSQIFPPLFQGLLKGLRDFLGRLISGDFRGAANIDFAQYFQEQTIDIAGDLRSLMGNASTGFGGILNQFGLVIQTGNKMVGSGISDMATVFYKGTADIANGFQSVHTVYIIGTTNMIKSLSQQLNIANAGVVTQVDTLANTINGLEVSFQHLIDYINITFPTIPPGEEDGGGGPSKTKTVYDWNIGRVLLGALGGGSTIAAGAWAAENKKLDEFIRWFQTKKEVPAATGGIFTRPTHVLAGEAGPEAIVPLNKAGVGGQTIMVNFNGPVYGMDDFNKKVEQSVGRYVSKVKGGAY